ncbi:adenine deaminase [Desulfotalea psychrophila]|uniref:Adenine deaminase 2 n=1 Tax=Desulfotalea psychrophila (strain LSv54 / DSM 12343) TaxID=177439 RepID=ADEC2_DESPS|nr:adenine deaminase [Desulfotalea psychrophila]Q6ANH1.1 RecName: Full=Adenine deaminase 2; Short=Adenase 2; Short=Adenine aminase 2 [Desulfotalea psychrophila LSv54]CAG36103.1 related to adenine deaminase [Desulfotalea psychrophila LSv54]
MNKEALKRLIAVAAGREEPDLVIKNAKVVDVFNARVIQGDIAIVDGLIAGVGDYSCKNELDAEGQYAAPGFIDSHIHIESSYVSPEELGRLLVPHGTTTIIADPHEIANVCGLKGLDYMIEAAKRTALDVQMMLPSCVPATPFEHSGANIDAREMEKPITYDEVLGLGEFMDFPGVINGVDATIEKLLVAKRAGKPIDGHSPGVSGNALNAYASARIGTDHECATVEEMHERIARGMYVLLRQGSACYNLRTLLKGVTPVNSRRCLFCADDCQPKTILSLGHLDNHLRICAEEGIDPIMAIQMATINAAECFGLKDRGAIAPGLKADIVLMDSLTNCRVEKVWIDGVLIADSGKYLPEIKRHDISSTKGNFKVKDFSVKKLKLAIQSPQAHVINILPGGVVTSKEVVAINRNSDNEFVYGHGQDVVKIAVVERHQNTGNVAVALLQGYGIKRGAIALSVAHDSHNIIVVGVDDTDMACAVEALIAQDGGIVLVNGEEVVESMPMPIAGLMSDQCGEWVEAKLTSIHSKAHEVLGVNADVEPVMTLCFMSLAVIPEIKLTDMGLFDVTKFDFISLEA